MTETVLMLQAFRNGKLLTGAGIELDRTLLVRDGRIEAVVGAREVVGADRVIDLGGDLLVPGFIDAQVNGGGGVLFNDDPSADDHRHHRPRAPAFRHHGFSAHTDQRRSRRRGARHGRGRAKRFAPAFPACSASTSKGRS